MAGKNPPAICNDKRFKNREGQTLFNATPSQPGVAFHLICGCGHSGLLNTLNHAAKISGKRRALTIKGGLHLGSYDNETKKLVTVQFVQWEPRRIIPLHCTGIKGSAQLWSWFGDIVEFHGAGETIELT